MKRELFFTVIAGCLLAFGIPGSSLAGPPESGEIAEESVTATGAPPFEVGVTESNRVEIQFPLRSDQFTTSKEEESLPQDPEVKVFASYAYPKKVSESKTKWVEVGQKSFTLETGEIQDNQVPAHMSLQAQRTWYWVRTWAKDVTSGNWVWIDESSPFCRYDDEGNPGYEFLVNLKTGEAEPVPSNYDTRD